ncbi:MAG: hypothetical protein QXU20_02480 [Candidatus Woesearchaeota archaeon]
MKRSKIGAELSVNVIIIAVLALLVLVVLFAIFTGRMNIFNWGIRNLETCPSGSTAVDTKKDCAGTVVGYTVETENNKKVVKYCCSS